mgnify:CR=1 FL=1
MKNLEKILEEFDDKFDDIYTKTSYYSALENELKLKIKKGLNNDELYALNHPNIVEKTEEVKQFIRHTYRTAVEDCLDSFQFLKPRPEEMEGRTAKDAVIIFQAIEKAIKRLLEDKWK